jgi:hypothetical protein
LADGRAVVVKVRQAAGRLVACAAVQRHLFEAGFPCPEPLVGPHPLGEFAASAEVLVPEGEIAKQSADTAQRHARLLAELVRLAPPVGLVGELSPSPPWVAWDHRERGLWPKADDREEDLNAVPTGARLDEVAVAVRQRLARFEGAESGAAAGWGTICGHGDFEAQNIRWVGGEALAVHDWDSAVAAAEPVLVGYAAAVWPAGMDGCFQATVSQSEEFLEAYQRARGIRWGRDEVEAAWAAGLWVLAFNAKKASIDGVESLSQAEITERMRRSGIRKT